MVRDNNILYRIKRKFQLFSNDLQSFKTLHYIFVKKVTVFYYIKRKFQSFHNALQSFPTATLSATSSLNIFYYAFSNHFSTVYVQCNIHIIYVYNTIYSPIYIYTVRKYYHRPYIILSIFIIVQSIIQSLIHENRRIDQFLFFLNASQSSTKRACVQRHLQR